jgi:chitinase
MQMDKPTEKPSATRPPESKHTSAKTSSDEWESCSVKPRKGRADEPRPKRQCRRPEKHIVRTTAIQDVDAVGGKNTIVRDLECGKNPEPCLHYRSVINHNPGKGYNLNACPYVANPGGRQGDLAAKVNWEGQHPKNGWWDLIPARAAGLEKGCEADEWPPYILYWSVDGYDRAIDPEFAHRDTIDKPQFIRLLDGTQNGRVGNKWRCSQIASRHSTNSHTHSTVGADRTTTFYTDWTGVYTRTTYLINPVVDDPDNDDGLSKNDCYPRGNAGGNKYQGFALLNDDPWYTGKQADQNLRAGYKTNPKNAKKRGWVDPERVFVVGANSSRRATDDELRDKFNLLRCESDNCEAELQEYADDGAVPYGAPLDEVDMSVDEPVLSTTTLEAGVIQTGVMPATPKEGVGEAKLPRQTQVW